MIRGTPGEYSGRQLGKFQISEQIATDAFGAVYHGSATDTGASVMVRVVKSTLAAQAAVRTRFLREAQILMELQHPAIAQVLGWGDKDPLYMVTEYFTGLPIKVPAMGLPVAEVRNHLTAISKAMHYVHSRGIVHRDLRPTNVLISGDRIKIIGFASARSDDLPKVTRIGFIMGTPAYMSPEQLAGSVCDARSDLYSLGILTYEMLTGSVPFPGRDVVEVVMAMRQTPLTSLCQGRPHIPRSFDDLVHGMLEPNPAKRFPSLEPVIKALGG